MNIQDRHSDARVSEPLDCQVVIIGGGPAGSATAAYLAKAGITCTVLERERFPRAHVGESLVPSSTRILRDLELLQAMEDEGFPHKYGAAWTIESNPRISEHDWKHLPDTDADIRFSEREQPGVDQKYTYHVDRARFDQMLLQKAEAFGARVMQECSVQDVDFSDQDRVQVRYRRNDISHTVTAKMVVDASGRRTFLGNKLGLRVSDPEFDQYALHAWFEDYDRGDSSKSDYLFVHFLPINGSWVWQIPITETITSIGVVTQRENFKKAKGSYEEFFWDCVAMRPMLSENLRSARQLRPLKTEADYSYAMSRFCGDRWLMVGDAARFVDPIFSSGVSVALQGARMASEAIIDAAKRGDFSSSSFEGYEAVLRQGCANWYNFISLYYRLNILFTYFVNHPQYRHDVLRLLQGDVYDEEEPAVLQKMREIVTAVEQDENHLWHDLLSKLRASAFDPGASNPSR